MNFLAPFALALAGAAAVPLLLHLLRRRTGEKVDFPALRYLLRAQMEHKAELRLRNLLLMLLRVFAIVALAAAAARPVGRLAGSAHAPTALAIVLDNSLSTSAVASGTPVLARLKDAARATLGAATAADRLWLVTADGRAVGGNANTLRAELDRVVPLHGAGDPHAAVMRALQLVRSAGLPSQHLAVLTDAQATTWNGPVELDGVTASVFTLADAPPKNRSILRAVAEPLHWTPRGAVRASTSAADSVTYRVALGARAIARGTVAPGAEIVVRAAPTERGWLAGTVELEPDELRADDVRWFAVHIGAAPAVVADPTSGIFARSAIDALALSGRVSRGADIVVTGGEAARKPGVIFAPRDPVQLGAANRALERAGVPWHFGAARTGPTPVHGTGLAGVTASHWYALESRGELEAGSVDTLARAGTDAWAVAANGYVVIASPLTVEATDLPLRASWVPWLGAAIADHLSREGGAMTEAAPGASVPRPVWSRELEAPDGSRRPVRNARVEAPVVTGVYFWMRGAARAGALVVNSEVAESDLARLSGPSLRARFTGADASVTADLARWTAGSFGVGGRQALDTLFLGCGLLLLAAEAIVTRAVPLKPGKS